MNQVQLRTLCLFLVSTSTVVNSQGGAQVGLPSQANENAQAQVQTNTIMDVGRNDPQYSTLFSALDSVGLTEELSQPGPFTLFAPTNEAFASTGITNPVVVRYLQQPAVWAPQVIDLLTHHVVEDELYALDLTQSDVGTELYTLHGAPLTITSTSPLQLEGVPIVRSDILGSNGVLHSIDESLLLPTSVSQNLADVITGMPFLSSFARYLDQSGLLEMLEGEGPFTILAPTDEAFDRVSDEVMADWEADPLLLLHDLQFHFTSGNLLEEDFGMETPIARFNNLTFDIPLDGIAVGDILANNGVLHIVDRFQRPPQTLAPTYAPNPTSMVGILQARGNFNMLLDSLQNTGRLRDLTVNGPANPFTVFAPTDASFVDLPEKFLDETWETHLINVLTYHIYRGNLYTANLTLGQQVPTLNFNALEVTGLAPTPAVDGVPLAESDIVADNGIIHVVDELLLPPSATNYVMDLYALFPEFDSWVEIVDACNLTSYLSGEGPMTVMSPVGGAIRNLLSIDAYDIDLETWKQIILYHIIPGKLVNFAGLEEEHNSPRSPDDELYYVVDDDDMMGNMTSNVTLPPLPPIHTFEVTTLQGSNITITVQENRVGIAGLLFEDLLVKNGIVQVLDTVLIPPNVTLPLKTATVSVPTVSVPTVSVDSNVSVSRESGGA